MPEEMIIQIPKKLAEFIDKLTEKGYFNSREDFARCSLEIVAQLYGLSKTMKGGKSILDILVDNGHTIKTPSKTHPSPQKQPTSPPLNSQSSIATTQKEGKSAGELTTLEYDVLDLFSGATFEFEDALHARYTMELMKQAKPPLPKKDFVGILEKLAEKKKLERTEHKGKVVWKVLENY